LRGSGGIAPAKNGQGNGAPAVPPAGATDERDQEFIVVYPSEQKRGYVEHIERTYGPAETAQKRLSGKGSPASGKGPAERRGATKKRA
jgi:hypothetical protein